MAKNTINAFPCLRGVLGKWVFYSTVMSAQQISDRISTVKSIREAESLDDHLQRELKNNVKKISDYLTTNNWRMFNSIVVGVFGGIPDWVSFDLSNIPALSSYDDCEVNTISDSTGLLVLNGDEKMFAIDGQHRVEAIKCAIEKGGPEILQDQYPIILVAHSDDVDGKKRTRRLFADINKKAVRVSKGDLVIIDEEDIHAVVARKIYADYKHFKGGELISLTANTNLEHDDIASFTNLLSIYNVVKTLRPRGIKTTKWTDEDVDLMYKTSTDFFDFIINNSKDLKSFFIEKNKTIKHYRQDIPNALFRPVGLNIISKVYKHFLLNEKLPSLKNNINKIDFSLSGNHLNLVIWNKGKMEVGSKNQSTCVDLILYLLSELTDEDVHSYEAFVENFNQITKGARKLPPTVIK